MTAQSYYDRYWTSEGYNPRRDHAPDFLRRLFDQTISSDDDCLDIGCGDGGTSGIYLSQCAKSYVGVDISETAVALAKDRGLKALHISDSELPFHDQSFDVVLCIEVLHHLFEPYRTVAEALRVLRPNGRLIVTVPNGAYWRDRLDALVGVWQPGGDDRGRAEPWRSPTIRFFRPATLRRMLLSAGFDCVEMIGVPSPLLGRVPVLRRFCERPGAPARAAASIFPSLLAGGAGAVALRDTPDASIGNDEKYGQTSPERGL